MDFPVNLLAGNVGSMHIKTAVAMVILSLTLWCSGTAIAQKFNFKVYSVNNGLPHGQVHDIEQTHNGFVWLATLGGGLSRFDGTNFVTYSVKDGLNSDLVEVVFQDSKQRLWASTEAGGVFKFEGNRFVEAFPGDSLQNTVVLNIKELSNGDLWFATYRAGIFIYDGEELKRFTVDDGLPHQTVWDIWEREDGNILIATHDGLAVYDGERFTIYRESDGLSGSRIFRIDKDDEGRFWMATSNGITIWDEQSFEAIRSIQGVDLNFVYYIKKSTDGRMWIGTEHEGVFVHEDGNYRHITKQNGLSSDHIYSIFEDRDGNVWVATDENGVNIFQGEAYRYYGNESGLESEEVLSLHMASDNTLWVGTYEGIFSYDGTAFTNYGPLEGYTDSREIWDIAELPDGRLLFLMPDNAIYEFDGTTFSNFTERNDLEKWYTFDLFVYNDRLWIGTDEGLVEVREEGYRHYKPADGLVSNVIRSMHKGSDGNLWIATYNGLSVFDGKEFRNLRLSDGLAHSEINYITEDEAGNVWLGTGGGVSLLKDGIFGEQSEVINFGRDHGMKLFDTQFLWFDDNGDLWQGTNAGLQLLDVTGYRENGEMNISHYALTNEGIGVETNHKAILPGKDGKAYMGTMNGLLDFDPKALTKNEVAPEVYITDIFENSKPVAWNEYTDSLTFELGIPQYPSVTFPYGSQSLTFAYSGLSFGHSRSLKFRYKLEGFEQNWMPVTESRSATYTNIPPGAYTFRVQSGNGNGTWSNEAAIYSFSIDHPFWQSYWFYLLVAATVIGMGYLYTRFRLHTLEKTKLKQLVDEQTKDLQIALKEKETLLSEIHHRVKNNLAVITGLLELQMEYSDDDYSTRSLKESQRRV
ncbi:MAG: two-component regulator propeller domain-containing protein, partial [Balneolaceae bacterium]|nr:two-component regulator propeller domain-containing protein [Balneolaceae bacterium]